MEVGLAVSESFLVWHRSREYDSVRETVQYRGGRHQQRHAPTQVVACRYWYELTDGYWGQFTLTNLPHQYARDLLPRDFQHLDSMQNFVGMIEYLMSWKWFKEPGIVHTSGGLLFRIDALPFLIDDQGDVQAVGTEYLPGACVFCICFLVYAGAGQTGSPVSWRARPAYQLF